MCESGALGIDPESDEERQEFLDDMASDRWDESDLIFSLERAYCYINKLLGRD